MTETLFQNWYNGVKKDFRRDIKILPFIILVFVLLFIFYMFKEVMFG